MFPVFLLKSPVFRPPEPPKRQKSSQNALSASFSSHIVVFFANFVISAVYRSIFAFLARCDSIFDVFRRFIPLRTDYQPQKPIFRSPTAENAVVSHFLSGFFRSHGPGRNGVILQMPATVQTIVSHAFQTILPDAYSPMPQPVAPLTRPRLLPNIWPVRASPGNLEHTPLSVRRI